MNPIVLIELYNVCDPRKTYTHARSVLDLRNELREQLKNPSIELSICATSLYVETDPLMIKVTIYPEREHGSVLEAIHHTIHAWMVERDLDKHRTETPMRIYGIVPQNAQRIPWPARRNDGTLINCTSSRNPKKHAV